MIRSCFIQSPSWRSCFGVKNQWRVPGYRAARRRFRCGRVRLFQLDFEPYLFLTRDQKRSCMTEEGIVADEE